jgi:hypothetical protein
MALPITAISKPISRGASGPRDMGNDAHQYFLDICFFYEAG